MDKNKLLEKLKIFKNEITKEYSIWEQKFMESGKFDMTQFIIKCCLLKKFIYETEILQLEYNNRIKSFLTFIETSTYLKGIEYLFHNEKELETISKTLLTEKGLYYIFDPTNKDCLSFIGTMYDFMGNVKPFQKYVDNKGLYYYLKFMLAKDYECAENSDIIAIETIIFNEFKPFMEFADFFFFDKMFTKESKIFESGIQLKMLVIAPLKIIQELYDYIYNLPDINVKIKENNNILELKCIKNLSPAEKELYEEFKKNPYLKQEDFAPKLHKSLSTIKTQFKAIYNTFDVKGLQELRQFISTL